jgi:type I restriction enzyme M protein
MITGTLRSQVDKLWLEFFTGGITNPLTVIEQISFLMFLRLLDVNESRNEKKARRTGKPFESKFAPHEQRLRWSKFRHLKGEEMLSAVRDEVFPHLRNLDGGGDDGEGEGIDEAKKTTWHEYMSDAQLLIQKPSLLVTAVNMVQALPLDKNDTKGDLYEYMLGKLTTAGINGQFRTPRHIIRLMIELIDPKPDEVLGDPACGTAGFLVGVMLYLLEKYTSEQGRIALEPDEHGNPQWLLTGDKLEPYRDHIQTGMFHGFDFDATMLRISAMNLMLHGVDSPEIHYRDTLSNSFPDKFPKFAEDAFDVMLANPPFKGNLDYEDVHPSLLRKAKTKKTELLFVSLILRMLKQGGRSATIVPQGVLFGSSRAHVALRKHLIDDNQLEGVISLPSGVFKPYAGVATAILVFTKGGKTDQVFFYDVERDGYSLDDKRTPASEKVTPLGPVDGNDLPDVVAKWKERDPKAKSSRKAKSFFVPNAKIAGNKYDLSINRYKEIEYEEVEHDAPAEILDRLYKLQVEISMDLQALRGML